MIYDTQCNVYRTTTQLTKPYNRPTNTQTPIATYTCRLGRKNGNYSTGNPQATINVSWRIYLPINCDIKEADLVEINGVKYIIQNVYKPNNHHIECDTLIKQEG